MAGDPLNVEHRRFSLTFGRAMGKVVVTVLGPLDARTAPELRNRLLDLIDGQGNRQLVLELQSMTSIDRAGVAVLVDALKRLQRNAGGLVLSGPTRQVVDTLASLGVKDAFVIVPAWAHPAFGEGLAHRSLPAG